MNPLPRFVRATVAAAVLVLPLAAQWCPGVGSQPVASCFEAGPVALGCPGAANWPCWHLFTPAHREPAPHAGFTPGNAVALPRVLVAYHCTGWLLVAVLPSHVTTMGYVIDRPEFACAPATQ